eukprot:3644412-Amphidinium_carterae.3
MLSPVSVRTRMGWKTDMEDDQDSQDSSPGGRVCQTGCRRGSASYTRGADRAGGPDCRGTTVASGQQKACGQTSVTSQAGGHATGRSGFSPCTASPVQCLDSQFASLY